MRAACVESYRRLVLGQPRDYIRLPAKLGMALDERFAVKGASLRGPPGGHVASARSGRSPAGTFDAHLPVAQLTDLTRPASLYLYVEVEDGDATYPPVCSSRRRGVEFAESGMRVVARRRVETAILAVRHRRPARRPAPSCSWRRYYTWDAEGRVAISEVEIRD